ncbi:hypothetical protein N7491_011383, partial [Penicillium cf. griseofulvum]
THQLSSLSHSEISWIFGVYNFLIFFGGLQIGPIFDAKGPRALLWIGSALLVIMFIALGFCEKYWHFFVVLGVLGGIGTSFIFIVPVASIGHFFLRRRGAATGLAMAGGSIGGVIFPIMLEKLAPKIGFAWTTRAIGLVTLVLLFIGCLLPSSSPESPPEKSKSKRESIKSLLPDLTILANPLLALTTAGYITSYALYHSVSPDLAYLMVVFFNAGSFPGRWIPGILADKVGRYNMLIYTNLLALVAVLGHGGNVAATIVFAVVFGFASGSNISLVPVCVGELCPTEAYGRYYTTVYTIVSLGALTGVPIAGEIIQRTNGEYWGLIAFAGCSYAAGLMCFFAVKLLQWRGL